MWVMRLAYVLALGLTIAGLVHIGSLFGVPRLATAGPYDRLGQIGADGKFVALDDQGERANLLPFRDLAFVTAACRYDLAGGPVTMRAPLSSGYGALAIHDRYGQPYYLLTDKAARDGAVEVKIFATEEAAAADEAAASDDDDTPEGPPELRIVSPTPTGFALVRLFVAGESARESLRAAAASATCDRSPAPKVSS